MRTQLKNVRMRDSESIQSYFTRVFQIKEQIEAIGDSIEEAELVMTTMNGLPRSWDHLSKESTPEESLQTLAEYGRIVLRKKQG